MFPGYTEYVLPICHLLKEQAGNDEVKQAQLKQVLSENAKFVDPLDILLKC